MFDLKILKGPSGVGDVFPLKEGLSYTIGRAESCNIRLPSSGISKHHCRLTVLSPFAVEIEDLGSSNGTFVNGNLIKSYKAKSGDSILLQNYSLQLVKQAPEAAIIHTPPSHLEVHSDFQINSLTQQKSIPHGETSPNNSPASQNFLEKNIYPLADKLSQEIEMPWLLGIFLILWSLILVGVSLSPFSSKANEKIQAESIEVAKLYARQLARINTSAILELRYRDLVYMLDAKVGQTPGLKESYVLDSTKGQVLAPAELLGQPITSKAALLAIQQEHENVNLQADGTAYVSVPIRITQQGVTSTAATVLVVYSTLGGQFSLVNLLEQIINSLLISLVLGSLFLVFAYRWIIGTWKNLSHDLDVVLKQSHGQISVPPIKWPLLKDVYEHIGSIMGRSSASNSSHSGSEEGIWAQSICGTSQIPTAAFDSQLQVTAWNSKMAQLTGISTAVGLPLKQASRDFSFEAKVQELTSECSTSNWQSAQKEIDISGRNYIMSFTGGSGAYLLQITLKEE